MSRHQKTTNHKVFNASTKTLSNFVCFFLKISRPNKIEIVPFEDFVVSYKQTYDLKILIFILLKMTIKSSKDLAMRHHTAGVTNDQVEKM